MPAVTVSRILHAGYLFKYNQSQIIFDPIFENPFSFNCYAFPNVKFNYEQITNLKLDAIFISHYHDDHCSLESLNYLSRETPIYIYCIHNQLFSLIQELGFKNVYSLELNVAVQINDFKITTRQALDADVDSIFHIEVSNFNILNVVDSWIPPHTLNQHLRSINWDLILWPFQTMNELQCIAPKILPFQDPEIPTEWSEQLQILKPKHLIASSCQFQFESWSWLNHKYFPISYDFFTKHFLSHLPDCNIINLNPSQTFELLKEQTSAQGRINNSLKLNWIQQCQNTEDYQYSKDRSPPQTKDIAKHFTSLTSAQHLSVLDFCKNTLLKKYSDLEVQEESYFSQSRIWQLSVYDHNGLETCFYYQIFNQKIQLLSEKPFQIDWLTEIPILKLFSALHFGESLSSLYIRINDYNFDNKTLDTIKNYDVLEDPLLRCLFNKEFASYQKAQLYRLKQKVLGHEKTLS